MNISRGLFEEHKLIFAFLIIIQIQLQKEEIDPALWGVLLRGPPAYDQSKQPAPPNKYQLAISE